MDAPVYPILRFAKESFIHRSAPPLGHFNTHVRHHRIWPVDIDVWMELNNGRTLTLFDLGRMILLKRVGAVAIMREKGWAGTVAGASARYRRRLQLFQKVEMRSRIRNWDDRFLHIEQALYRDGTAAGHALLRSALTDRTRLIPMSEAAEAIGVTESPPLPEWVSAWSTADDLRPWPPISE